MGKYIRGVLFLLHIPQPLPTSQLTSVHQSGLFSTVVITSHYGTNIAAPINFKLLWDFQMSGKIPKNEQLVMAA